MELTSLTSVKLSWKSFSVVRSFPWTTCPRDAKGQIRPTHLKNTSNQASKTHENSTFECSDFFVLLHQPILFLTKALSQNSCAATKLHYQNKLVQKCATRLAGNTINCLHRNGPGNACGFPRLVPYSTPVWHCTVAVVVVIQPSQAHWCHLSQCCKKNYCKYIYMYI